jgi:hypothetical protein
VVFDKAFYYIKRNNIWKPEWGEPAQGADRCMGYFISDNVAQFLPNLPGLFGANSLNLARYVLGHGEPLEKLRQCFPLNQKRAPSRTAGSNSKSIWADLGWTSKSRSTSLRS